MEEELKNWSEHPAYKEEDLEIKNEEELRMAKVMAMNLEKNLHHDLDIDTEKELTIAKKVAGVAKSHEEVLDRLKGSEIGIEFESEYSSGYFKTWVVVKNDSGEGAELLFENMEGGIASAKEEEFPTNEWIQQQIAARKIELGKRDSRGHYPTYSLKEGEFPKRG